jgi:serine/threonine protein kinase
LAAVFDFGFHEGQPFTSFEYIPGETLRELLARRGALPLEDARLILGPLAQALDFAHSHHVALDARRRRSHGAVALSQEAASAF